MTSTKTVKSQFGDIELNIPRYRGGDFEPQAIPKYTRDKAFCATKSNVKFIDATSGFVDKNGYLTNTSDRLHIINSKVVFSIKIYSMQ